VDELTDQILVETDTAKRDELIRQAFQLAYDDIAYIPLHQQGLAWGKSDRVTLKQRADNVFMMYHVNIK